MISFFIYISFHHDCLFLFQVIKKHIFFQILWVICEKAPSIKNTCNNAVTGWRIGKQTQTRTGVAPGLGCHRPQRYLGCLWLTRSWLWSTSGLPVRPGLCSCGHGALTEIVLPLHCPQTTCVMFSGQMFPANSSKFRSVCVQSLCNYIHS
jgi:hypothetical protein